MAAALNSATLLLASLVAIGAQLLEPESAEFLEVGASRFHNQKQLDDSAIEVVEGSGVSPPSGNGHCCPSGWFTYLDSCYLYVRERRQFKQAEHYCFQRQATLLVVDALEEWNKVRIHSTAGYWSWIGLRVVSNMKPIRPTWETSHGMDPEKLPWLIKRSPHGWASGSDCASYFQSFAEAPSHIIYTPCFSLHYFVCERNATEIADGSDNKESSLDPSVWWA